MFCGVESFLPATDSVPNVACNTVPFLVLTASTVSVPSEAISVAVFLVLNASTLNDRTLSIDTVALFSLRVPVFVSVTIEESVLVVLIVLDVVCACVTVLSNCAEASNTLLPFTDNVKLELRNLATPFCATIAFTFRHCHCS